MPSPIPSSTHLLSHAPPPPQYPFRMPCPLIPSTCIATPPALRHLQVLSVHQNENMHLWRPYCHMRERIRMQLKSDEGAKPCEPAEDALKQRLGLDATVNERLVFFATDSPSVHAKWGFRSWDKSCEARNGSLGLHFAGAPLEFEGTVSDDPELCAVGMDSPKCCCIVVRACLGLAVEVPRLDVASCFQAPCVQRCALEHPCAHRRCHSVITDHPTSSCQDYILYNSEQCYPEFVVFFHQIEDKQFTVHSTTDTMSQCSASQCSVSTAPRSPESSPASQVVQEPPPKWHQMTPSHSRTTPSQPPTIPANSPPSLGLLPSASQASLAHSVASTAPPTFEFRAARPAPPSDNRGTAPASEPAATEPSSSQQPPPTKPACQGTKPKRTLLKNYDFASQFSHFVRGFERK